ncbi:MAG: hypothetical protein HC795_10805 [Coleofasciculaceae cyanobacterium RL_1_1]|nr:hypothetical protein [Coleofasciculaceae cyanobacterium RL_1_1]
MSDPSDPADSESVNSVNSESMNPVNPAAHDAEAQPDPAQILHIGLGALTSNNGRQLCAQLDRCWTAIELEPNPTHTASPTKSVWSLGCLVRPLGSPISPHWKAAQSYDRFAQHDRGLVVEFSLDDILPLLALRRLEAEIGDRERMAAESLSSTPSNRSTTTLSSDPDAINSQSSVGVTPDLSHPLVNSPAAELSSTEETRSAASTDRPAPPDSAEPTAEPTIESTYEREFGLESPRLDSPTSTDAANQDAAMHHASNEDDREIDQEVDREIDREVDPGMTHGDEQLVDPEHPHPDPNDRAALSTGLSNNRWSRFPSAKPIRDLAITRELLAAWIDRENIAIDNVMSVR